jgi:penicillin-binding protein 2
MNSRSRAGMFVLQALVLSLLLTLLGRLFYLQVTNTTTYKVAAAGIQSRDVITPAIRGSILDDQGRPMAIDEPGLEITVDRSVVDKLKDKGDSVFARLAPLLGVTKSDIFYATRLCGEIKGVVNSNCWKGNRYQPIPITQLATQSVALKVLENQSSYPGINAVQVPVRSYPSTAGENAAHVLGYVGSVTESDLANPTNKFYRDELIGKAGLEYQYDSYLRGTPGIRTLIVDRKEAVTSQATSQTAKPGNNLVTNINAPLQAVTERALQTAVMASRAQGHRADSGAAIVEDVKTGAIVAMASFPTYDPSIWQKGLTQTQAKNLFGTNDGIPALSRPLTGEYPPASTFKAISVVAAIHAGYNMNSTYECPASVQVGNHLFKNFEYKSQGTLDMQQLIAVSCDTVWYKIAYDQWLKDGGLRINHAHNDYFFKAAAGFNLGKTTGIDLPGEVSGRLPDRAWKQNFYLQNKSFWCNFQSRAKKSDLTPYLIALAKEDCVDGNVVRAGDAVNFSIGQGDTLITPIQEATIYSSIANGGTIYQPQVAKAIVSPTGKVIKKFTPVIVGHTPTQPSDIAFLHAALRSVATSGTGAPIFGSFPIHVAGKTGTGQVSGANPDGSPIDDTSWFASFAPVEDPQFAVIMVVSQGGFGASSSAVGVKQIYSAIYGVTGQTVDTAQGLFPHGVPTAIPTAPRKTTLSRAQSSNGANNLAPLQLAVSAATPSTGAGK